MPNLTQQTLPKIIQAMDKNVLAMTTQQIAEKTGVKIKNIRYILTHKTHGQNFTKIGDRQASLYKLTAAGHCNAIKPMVNKKIKSIDSALTQLCATVEYGKNLTVAEIAAACGCSTTHIKNIENSALKKLRASGLLRQYC